LGHTLFSNVGSKGRRRLEKLLPPYLRSWADQTGSK
jgi:hypothetical protein